MRSPSAAPLVLLLLSGLGGLVATPGLAQQSAAPANELSGDRPPPRLRELLQKPELVARGDAIWKEQCTHCHGSKAYPGKAPKLAPRRYTPEFVWDRVHNGFRGMPPWKEVYSEDDIVAVVAYVLSDEFWP